jgi:hypothetical protein
VDLHIHSPICFHGVVAISTGTTLRFTIYVNYIFLLLFYVISAYYFIVGISNEMYWECINGSDASLNFSIFVSF